MSYRRIRVAIARINSYLQEHVNGIAVLQLFNREKRAYDRFVKINAALMDAFKDAIMAYAVYYPVVEILSAIAVAAIIWFGGGHVIQNIHTHTVTIQRTAHFVTLRVVPTVTTIGILVAFMQYAQRFFRPIQDLSDKYNILQSAMASSERRGTSSHCSTVAVTGSIPLTSQPKLTICVAAASRSAVAWRGV